jgi:regulator of protease activity HflC (stomatin/prohibitin superfamily)
MAVPPSPSLPERQAAVIADRRLRAANGFLMLAVGLVLLAVSLFAGAIQVAFLGAAQFSLMDTGVAIAGIIASIFILNGLVVLQPNTSLVCLLFGSYAGTLKRSGFWWVNPFNSKKKVSRRLETLECGPLKVNDAVGNPIDIGAVIVWRVQDAAKAILEVESYALYVKAQSETALRRMASTHPYDQVEVLEAAKLDREQGASAKDTSLPPTVTLRDGGDAVSESLLSELRKRMEPIGIAVDEARISHLAYSSEIAGIMLRKQAASAVVAARRLVVRGAVSIVEEALGELDKKKIGAPLDPERKAAMISNLLVVLVADREATPIINTGAQHP